MKFGRKRLAHYNEMTGLQVRPGSRGGEAQFRKGGGWPRFGPDAVTGVPYLQENASPYDPTVGLRLGSWGSPGGGAFFYGRGTLVDN